MICFPVVSQLRRRGFSAVNLLLWFLCSQSSTTEMELVASSCQACKTLRDLASGKRVHFSLKSSNIYMSTRLVDMYAKCESMTDSRAVFQRVPCYDLPMVNALILGYAENGDGASALGLFESMQLKEGWEPDSRTFVAVITACSRLAEQEQDDGNSRAFKLVSLEKGMRIHSQAVLRGEDRNIFVENSLVDMYSKCKSLVDARAVFDKMAVHDSVSWNSLILGYVENGECELALELFSCMGESGCVPDSRTYVAAFKACGSLAEKEGRKIDSTLVRVQALEKGANIHEQARKRNGEDFITNNVYVANSLLEMYAKCRTMENAHKVFFSMHKQDVVSWTSLIVGYTENDQAKMALSLYWDMKAQGCIPDSRTYATVLMACGSLGALETGRKVHSEIRERGLGNDPFLANCLVDFYGKCGATEDAEEVFSSIKARTVVTWTALISGYSRLGRVEEVFRLVERMQDDGCKPNGVTLLLVLTACSHAGLVETGKDWFEKMILKFGITPEIEHYRCMVDMLARGNRLESAVEMVERMPFEADEVTWKTVLAACRKFGNVRLGRVAFEALLKIGNSDSSAYTLMADLVAFSNEDCH